ncbi:MAG: hypothetical protein ACYDGY_06470 [Acidimicrobiales bacterium]
MGHVPLGTTLRGLLLEAFGFWQIGQFALIGSIVSYVMAGILLLLLIPLGLWHIQKASSEEELFTREKATLARAA